MLTVVLHYRNQRETSIDRMWGTNMGFILRLRLIVDHFHVNHVPDLINKYSG